MRHLPLIPAFLLIAPGLLCAQLTDRGAKVPFFTGKAVHKKAGDKEWNDVKINMRISSGDALRTQAGSRVDVETPEGTVVNIMENSVVELTELLINARTKAAVTRIKVKSGTVLAGVKKLTSSRSSFEFETPTALAVVRGTELEIDVSTGKTRVRVKDGQVEVRNKAGGKPAFVYANQQAVVDEGRPGVIVESVKAASAGSGGPGAEVALEILSPADGAACASLSVPFSGRTEPGAVIKVNGVLEVAPSAQGAFSGAFAFPEGASGDQALVFTAIREGRTANRVLKVVLGATPVARSLGLSVTEPLRDALLTSQMVKVSGSAVQGALIRFPDGREAPCADGTFSGLVKLPSGEAGRYEIKIVAEYKGAVQAVSVPVSIIEVPREMLLIINRPSEGEAFVRRHSIPVEGVTLPSARVTFGSGAAVTPDSSGLFKGLYEIPRQPGPHELSVTSSAGGATRKATVTINVTAGAVGCPVDIVEPYPGAEVPVTFEVKGSVDNPDNKTQVLVNGVPAAVAGGVYSAKINTGFRIEQGARVGVTVTSPAPGAVIKQLPVIIRGRVSPPLARVFLDGAKQAKVLSDGTFEAEVPMPDESGDYSVEVSAVMQAGEIIKKPYDVIAVSECGGIRSAPVKTMVNVNVGAAPASGEARASVAFRYEKQKYDLILMALPARCEGGRIEIEVRTNAVDLRADGRILPIPGPGGTLRSWRHVIDNTDAACFSAAQAVFTARDESGVPQILEAAVPIDCRPVNLERPSAVLSSTPASPTLDVTVFDGSFGCEKAGEEVTAVVEASGEGVIADLTFSRNGQIRTVGKVGGVNVRYTVRAVDRGNNAATADAVVPAFITGRPRITLLSPASAFAVVTRATRDPGFDDGIGISFRIDDVDDDDARLLRRVEFRSGGSRPLIFEGAAIPPDLIFDDIVIPCPAADFSSPTDVRVLPYTIRVIDVRERVFQLSGSVTLRRG